MCEVVQKKEAQESSFGRCLKQLNIETVIIWDTESTLVLKYSKKQLLEEDTAEVSVVEKVWSLDRVRRDGGMLQVSDAPQTSYSVLMLCAGLPK
jgi:hypothetical protein